jgi:hypothetical protein
MDELEDGIRGCDMFSSWIDRADVGENFGEVWFLSFSLGEMEDDARMSNLSPS